MSRRRPASQWILLHEPRVPVWTKTLITPGSCMSGIMRKGGEERRGGGGQEGELKGADSLITACIDLINPFMPGDVWTFDTFKNNFRINYKFPKYSKESCDNIDDDDYDDDNHHHHQHHPSSSSSSSPSFFSSSIY